MEHNEAIIRAVFDETARGNTRALAEAMSDDCSWTFPGNWSWAGTWSPKAVVVDGLLAPIMRQLGGQYRLTADTVIAAADQVVVQARGSGVTTRGEPYEQTYCFLFRLASGRITEVVEHCDTALVERILDHVRPPAA